MSATEAVARMLTLVPWLLERPGASVAETADAFGVDQATIREDLSHLDFCGLPGLGGGDLFEVSIVGDRILVRMADELRRPLRLTPREALRLVLVADAAAEALGEDLPALRSALDKVRDAAGVPRGVTVQLDQDGGRWLAEVRRAIAGATQIEIDYRGRGDATPRTRVVDPWALHVTEGSWYLQGHDHDADARRTFRLDRVAALRVLDTPRAIPPPDAPLPPPRYVPGPHDLPVELLLGPGARWVADAVEIDDSEELDDGWRRIRFHTDALPWVERLLLMAGPQVTVVEPAELAAAVRDEAARALERYG